jgi:cytochrome P450
MLMADGSGMGARRGERPPGPWWWTPFGAGRALRRDPLAFVTGLAREFGDVVLLRMGPVHLYLLFHPDHVRHVLQENHQNYVKGPIIARTKVLIGEGLFTSEGDFWLRQRRLAQPAFHRARIAGFADTMVRATAERLARWERHVERGEPLDVAAEMSELTLTVVGRTLFGRDLSEHAEAAGRALRRALEFTAERTMSYLALPLALPTASHRAFRRALGVLDGVVYDVIESRRRTQDDAGDLLAMLMAARDEETGEGMTARQLRDEVMTFFLAGHETTAVTLAWTWYLLARHPEVAARLYAEVAGAIGERLPTIDDLPRLSFTRMVVEETLRLYPPVWGIGRQALRDDAVGGYRLPAGAVVNLSPYTTHRHPEFWPDPERFDPERFAPGRASERPERPRFAYFPFSGGPRLCIGETFAMVEAQIVVAMVVQRFRLGLTPGQVVTPEVHLTLRPRGGLPMTIERAAPSSRRAGARALGAGVAPAPAT